MMLQVGDDGVVSSVNEEDLIYVDKNELEQFVESYHQLEKENKKLKQTIREAYENERTQLGKSVLKQLMEAIQ